MASTLQRSLELDLCEALTSVESSGQGLDEPLPNLRRIHREHDVNQQESEEVLALLRPRERPLETVHQT